jgi:hypothetical protein
MSDITLDQAMAVDERTTIGAIGVSVAASAGAEALL